MIVLVMRVVIGVLVILAGVAAGLYVGLWLMLVGGIVQLVEAVKADPVEATDVAWGAVRILLAIPAGGLVCSATVVFGMALLGHDRADPWRPGGLSTAKQVEADYWRNMNRRQSW